MLKSWEDLPEFIRKDEVFQYYQMLQEKRFQLLFKRIADTFFSIIGVILLMPIMLMIAGAIKVTSRGPVFFKQDRVTQYGRVFKILKFRTMVVGAENIGAQVTSQGDQRITKIGRILRKYRLDELPQIINVLKGDMSFVGARPEVTKYVTEYTPKMLATLLLPAGITAKASIEFKDEEQMLEEGEDIDNTYIKQILPVKMKYNLEYIQNYSLWKDIKIIGETGKAVFWRKKTCSKKKYQIGLCGHLAKGQNCLDGQTIRTNVLYEEMTKLLGAESITYIDTYKWSKHPIRLLLNSLRLAKHSKHVIIGCCNRGRKVFLVLFYVYAKLFKCKIHEVIIGGNYINQLRGDALEGWLTKRVTDIYVETDKMRVDLIELGYKNVYRLSNLINLEKVELEEQLMASHESPIRLCTFSRVCKEKGTEDIIAAVENVNTKYGRTIFELDIYGRIEKEYEKQFNEIMQQVPEYIQYKGTVEFTRCVEVLKDYFMLIFPTYLPGEGMPGTVINAFFAGVPILASDWAHNTEFIEDGVTGVIYKTHNIDELTLKLEEISENPQRIIDMKQACLKESDKYSAELGIKQFLKQLHIS